MKASVVVFPGSNCDTDCFNVLSSVMGMDTEFVWHKETQLNKTDLVVLPGGFSYGDYLRTGAIARFSPIMNEVISYAKKGGKVIGICNGFQILLESGLLPGAMLPNRSMKFICKPVWLRCENNDTAFTNKMNSGQLIQIPIAHGEGNYTADDDTIQKLKDENKIIFKYVSETGEEADCFNPNGSRESIAGIINDKGNILGMMPHPERVSEEILGGVDGKCIWESVLV